MHHYFLKKNSKSLWQQLHQLWPTPKCVCFILLQWSPETNIYYTLKINPWTRRLLLDTMIFRFNVRLCGGGNDPCCKFSPKSASPKSCAGRRRFHPTVGSDMSLGSVVMATTHNRCPVGETWFGVFSSFLCSFFFCAYAFFFLFGLVLGLCFFLCGWNSTFLCWD